MNRLLSRVLCCSAVLLAAAHAPAQIPTYVPTDGLVGWWPFNGNANDESGNGNNGAVLTGTVLSTDRMNDAESAYNVDGLNCPTPKGISLPVNIDNSEYSVSIWCKSSDSTKFYQTIFNSYPHDGIAVSLNYGLPTTQNGIGVFFGNGEWILDGYDLYHNSDGLEDWKHYVFVKRQSEIRLYESNVLIIHRSVEPFADPIVIENMVCGAISINGGSGCYETFKGRIDDIGIWNRALTAEEVMALYLAAPLVAGCTDAAACNFNPEANVNDGSCVASGCLEPAACNFNPSAGCAGEACDYTCCPGPGCCGAGTVWDAEAGVCVPWAACPDVIYNPDFNSDGAITVADLLALLAIFEDVDSDGDGIFDSMDDCFGVYDGCGVCGGVGVDADDDGICDDVDPCVGTTDVVGVCGGSCTADADADGVCDTSDPCVGALDACGVCNGPGAVYTCGCADIPAGDCDCAGNQLDALGVCGGSCAADADGDGTCDDADPCVGTLDVCGVCNGPGPSVPVIDQIIFVTDSAFIPQINYWYVFTFAVDTLYTYVCPVLGCTDSSATNFNPSAAIDDSSCLYGPAQCGGLSTVTFDGHTYALVGIGTQCWFAENLRSDTYLNGDAIPGNLSDAQWMSTSSGAQTVYGEGSSIVYHGSSDEVANLATYGRLYNWFAVNDARGLCPSGFHVPSDGEWTVLENALGGSSVAGTLLKSSSPSWDGTNSSGFSALPGGYRYVNFNGSFYNQGVFGDWWASSLNGIYAWNRYLGSGDPNVNRDYHDDPRNGCSVRCVRDAELNACQDPDGDGVCAEDEVSGCTDAVATNFNSASTENDGSCTYPGPAQCGGASTVTFDGHTYALVGIGTQCWFAENLRSDNYLNGDEIPGNLNHYQWTSTTTGAQAVFNSDDTYVGLTGRLYNWYAVNDARGLCPSGFHVPSDGDWIALEVALGINLDEAVALGWRGTNQGAQLKSSSTDIPGWDGSNASGFSAVPSEARDGNYGHYTAGYSGIWTSTPTIQYAWSRLLVTGMDGISRYDSDSRRTGFAVRCVLNEFIDGCEVLVNDGVCLSDEVSGCTDAAASNFNSDATEDDGSCTYPGPAQCGGLSTVTFDGHTYALVGIGTQCWFAENLRSDNYLNGDPIPGNLNNYQWTAVSYGAQSIHNNSEASLAVYGRLYNWYSIDDSRGLFPAGFHVPSDGEWVTLINGIGGPDLAGSALKSHQPEWNGSNTSGFSGLPVGYRDYPSGNYYDFGNYAYWWTSSASGAHPWYHGVGSSPEALRNNDANPRYGFSIRCIQD